MGEKASSEVELASRCLSPYIGEKDREALIDLRHKRWKARAWMKARGIKDAGYARTAGGPSDDDKVGTGQGNA